MASLDTFSNELFELSPSLGELNPHAIVGINVEGLFGYLDYPLRAPQEHRDICRKLLVLYGDNGSGKTTILNLLYHMLSPEMKAGHRSAIAKVIFKRFEIALADGTTLRATRPRAESGSYVLTLGLPDGTRQEAKLTATERLKLIDSAQEDAALEELIKLLGPIGTTAYYLRDDRKILGEKRDNRRAASGITWTTLGGPVRNKQGDWDVMTMSRGDDDEAEDTLTKALARAVKKLNSDLHRELSDKMREGEASANTIYENVVRGIVMETEPASADGPEHSIAELAQQLRELASRVEQAKEYRIGSPETLQKMSSLLDSAPGHTRAVLASVLRPYIDGLRARIETLTAVINRYETLVETINSFLTAKRATLDLDSGLQVISRMGGPLPVEALSSGERQLLLILIRSTLLGGSRKLFIIDEPEISLNVKWQRRLLPAILRCVQNSPVQVVAASHSVPLITPFEQNVFRLRSPKRPDNARS
jgi:energy-coupling factor transporter ATP-binding protein EcfA2